jgi:hypothetical protein
MFGVFLKISLGEPESDFAPLLDTSASYARRGSRSGVLVKVWPGCGEGTISFPGGRFAALDADQREINRVATLLGREGLLDVGQGYAPRDYSVEGAVRAKGVVRRFTRFNSLSELVTFTFSGLVPSFDSLDDVMRNFRARFDRAACRSFNPSVWVPEWGKETNRLHIHAAVDWWCELNCTEVCSKCARANLVAKRSDIPRVGEKFCIGCLWGHGFVGRPDVSDNSDGRGLSSYLSKYLGKGFDDGNFGGKTRYRMSRGLRPVSQSFSADDEIAGVVALQEILAFDGDGFRLYDSRLDLDDDGFYKVPFSFLSVDVLRSVARV